MKRKQKDGEAGNVLQNEGIAAFWQRGRTQQSKQWS